MRPSETLVLIYQITWDHIPGDSNYSPHHYENLKSYNHIYFIIKELLSIHKRWLQAQKVMWCIARQWLAKHVPKHYAVSENRHPLLDNGFGYHSITEVSGTTHTWTAVLEPLKAMILIQFSWNYNSSEFKGRRNPEIQNSRDERQVWDSDNRLVRQKEFNAWAVTMNCNCNRNVQ
jgi:hypothetical protein